VGTTDLARRKPNSRLRAEVANLATAEKVLVMVVRLIRALGQVIVLVIAQIVVIAVTASSALIVAPVWAMQPSVRSVMRWSMLR
jgi:hypothetical protein